MLSCTILTCEACDGVRDLHTRMPVMLAKEGFGPWLAGENPTLDPCLDEGGDSYPRFTEDELAEV